MLSRDHNVLLVIRKIIEKL